jgi:hypothetical protein
MPDFKENASSHGKKKETSDLTGPSRTLKRQTSGNRN